MSGSTAALGAALSPLTFAAIGVGAALGAWLRWLLSIGFNHWHPNLPLGTWVANLLGGLLIGVVLAVLTRFPHLDPIWRLFVVTGFLGALTTFSTFSIESLALVQRGEFGWAVAHTLAHVLGCLAAAALGWRLVGAAA